MDPNGIQLVPQRDMLEEFLHTQEFIEDGRIKAIICDEKITIDQTLITQQLGVSVEGVVDVMNALVKEAQVALNNIVGLDAFINKKNWNIIQMKKEYHTILVTIMQIIYQQERLAYFNNHVAIIFNLANKGKNINRCSIMLTHCSRANNVGQESNNLFFWTIYKSLFMTLVSTIKGRYTY